VADMATDTIMGGMSAAATIGMAIAIAYMGAGTMAATGTEASDVKPTKIAAALLLVCSIIFGLSGCAVEHRLDGGLTFRPLHWW
jgi:hypothetical protein